MSFPSNDAIHVRLSNSGVSAKPVRSLWPAARLASSHCADERRDQVARSRALCHGRRGDSAPVGFSHALPKAPAVIPTTEAASQSPARFHLTEDLCG